MSTARFLPDALLSLSALSVTRPHGLLEASDKLLVQMREAVTSSSQCMLPSYTHMLPSGSETGSAIAIDLGGSTLRVAAVELKGHDASPGERLRIVARGNWRVKDDVKALPGPAFFDWIAERVGKTLQEGRMLDGEGRAVGVTWSFPIE